MKMKTPDTIEDEIDKIRLATYEKIKDMTPSQITEYYKRRTEPIIKKYGFKVLGNAKDKRKLATV